MNSLPENNQPPPSSLGVNDILFTIFRHKWKILALTALGCAASAAIWFSKKPHFESTARILVKYVSDTKSALDAGNIQSPDVRGNTILNSEIAILTSVDSILAAVRSVGAQKVLAAYGGGTNLNKAATTVVRNLQVDAGKNSSVIELSLRHPDAQVAQDLLDRLITNYKRRHLDIHRAGAAYDDLQAQTERLRAQLTQTEIELRNELKRAGVIDFKQAKQDTAAQLSTLRQAIFETEAAIAERRALLESRRIAGFELPGTNAAPANAVTNAPAALADAAIANALPPAPSPADLARYELLSQKLAALKGAELDLILQFKEGSSKVQQHRKQISELEEAIKTLGIDPATIPARAPVASGSSPALPAGPLFDSEGAIAAIRGLQMKYQTLTNQYARVRQDAERIDAAEDLISRLERQKSLDEAQYTYYAKGLEQARLDQALDATKLNNISVIQEPSPGAPADNKKTMKLAGGALAGGLGAGLALAFLLDLILDPSVKRRKDIEIGAQLPVLVDIPDFGRNGHSKLKPSDASAITLANGQLAWPNGEIPPWEETDPMLPYYEALRDRVVMSYGDDLHKPKIVGLTSCDENAGVTRLATGLAASLSRDVERNVMLIGLSKGKVAISAFAKGRPVEALDPAASADNVATTEALSHSGAASPSAADPADLLNKNLYSLATTGRNLAGASVVQSFSDLMPRLKMSDYDYIIFDLPPISQTSGAVRLASQLERTLLVVEAEKTSKEKIKEVKAQLARSKTQLATIYNRSRTYGPPSVNSAMG